MTDGADDRGLYMMSVAAELAGMHPQTLRLWERKGLIEPSRSAGGTRRYSDADIERLRQITDLTEAGVNLEGARRIIRLEAELAALRAQIDRMARTNRSPVRAARSPDQKVRG